MRQQALSVTVAWVRLERALERLDADLRRSFGITRLQLSVLHILTERTRLPLAALRKALVAHPATLGQAIDRLRVMGLVTVRTNENDRRARLVALTPEGAALADRVPLAGPVRLREAGPEAADSLDRLALALDDAVALFGLEDWVEDPRPRGKEKGASD